MSHFRFFAYSKTSCDMLNINDVPKCESVIKINVISRSLKIKLYSCCAIYCEIVDYIRITCLLLFSSKSINLESKIISYIITL